MIALLWAYDSLDIEANVPQHSIVNQKINIYCQKKGEKKKERQTLTLYFAF